MCTYIVGTIFTADNLKIQKKKIFGKKIGVKKVDPFLMAFSHNVNLSKIFTLR